MLNEQSFLPLINFFKVNLTLFLICCIAGCLTGLSAPGFDIWIFAWIGFIPLFVVISLEKSSRKAFIYSFGFGFFYHLIYLSWFVGLYPLGWLGLNVIQSVLLIFLSFVFISFYMAVLAAIAGLCISVVLKWNYIRVILIPYLWIFILQYLTSLGPFALPWAMIEYTQYNIDAVTQIAKYIGGTGLAYVILLVNTLLSLAVIQYINQKPVRKTLYFTQPSLYIVTSIVVILSLIAVGQFSYKDPVRGNLTATVVQSAFLIDDLKTGRVSRNQKTETYLDLIYQVPEGLIVLPEGTYNSEFKESYDREFFYLAANMKKSTILLGTYDELNNKTTNAVVAVNPSKKIPEEIPVYNKNHLVPFGEYTPFREYMPQFLEDIVSISAKQDFANGTTLTPLDTPVGKIGVLICFESIFPSMARALVNNGAEILVNTSNLGWFHNSIIDQQFIAMSVFRAIENNRYFIVSINNGSSVIISPEGKILASTKKNTKGFVSAKIKPVNALTFFTEWDSHE